MVWWPIRDGERFSHPGEASFQTSWAPRFLMLTVPFNNSTQGDDMTTNGVRAGLITSWK